MMAGGGGYWIIASDIRAGQPANANGLADIHLLHVAEHDAAPTPDKDLTLVSDGHERSRAAPGRLRRAASCVAAWETSTATGDFSQNAAGRQMWIQVLDATTGAAPAGSTAASAGPLKLTPNVLGSRYQDFRAYPDGSVAYPAPGIERAPRSRSCASSAAPEPSRARCDGAATALQNRLTKSTSRAGLNRRDCSGMLDSARPRDEPLAFLFRRAPSCTLCLSVSVTFASSDPPC